MQSRSESLRLSGSNSKTCDAVFNWDTRRYGELKDHAHVTWYVGLKVRVMWRVGCMLLLVAWCCDLHIQQMLSERGKIQRFLFCNKICNHSLCCYWNKNITFNAYWNMEIGWHTHGLYTHIMWLNKTPNKKGWHKQCHSTPTNTTPRGSCPAAVGRVCRLKAGIE